jgi:hypothetical protein
VDFGDFGKGLAQAIDGEARAFAGVDEHFLLPGNPRKFTVGRPSVALYSRTAEGFDLSLRIDPKLSVPI